MSIMELSEHPDRRYVPVEVDIALWDFPSKQPNGTKRVMGFKTRCPGIALTQPHRADASAAVTVLTHESSGLAIMRCETPDQAWLVAGALAGIGIDWTAAGDTIIAQMKANTPPVLQQWIAAMSKGKI